MPVVRELFGLRVTGPSQKHRKACRTAHCPHSMALCDGGVTVTWFDGAPTINRSHLYLVPRSGQRPESPAHDFFGQ